jgi:hypothetical protein
MAVLCLGEGDGCLESRGASEAMAFNEVLRRYGARIA